MSDDLKIPKDAKRELLFHDARERTIETMNELVSSEDKSLEGHAERVGEVIGVPGELVLDMWVACGSNILDASDGIEVNPNSLIGELARSLIFGYWVGASK